jgi:phage gp46-like protein
MEPGKTITPVKIENWSDVRELVLMSIGTDRNSWWADPAFGSDIWKLRLAGKIDSQTAGTFQRMLQECLAWLKDDGIVSDSICTAERSGKNEIAWSVTVLRLDREPVIIKDMWNAV